MSSRRGVLLVVLLMLFAVFVSIGGLIVLSMFSGAAPPSVPANATLYLDIQAPFSEIEPADVFSQFLRRPPTLRATLDAIRNAKADTRVKAMVIRVGAPGALWAQIQEVRAALEDYRTAGKPLTAYMEAGGLQEYYLASAADHIVMMPAGQLDVAGLASYELFFRGALDKIGVYPDMLHIGDFKTASNTFTEKTFTPAHREMTASLNRDWYDDVVRVVAKSRKLTEAAARAAVDGGPYLAEQAKQAGLVDQLLYEDQLDDAPPIKGTSRIDGATYARVPATSSLPREAGARIALLYAVGTIASGKSVIDSPGGLVLGSETFNEWLRKVRVDTSVRAVVVRIDSPGGSAIASEVLWRELMLTREVKPLIVSMGDVAASGGYYMAAPAHLIVAEPGTITGSIGVVTGKFVMQGALDKIGVGTGAVGDGKFADIYSPFRPFSTEERARVEAQMQSTYELFLSRVAEGRHQTTAKIDAVAQGRVWTGHQARELGLVDELGGLDDALRLAKQRAKLDPKKDVEIVTYPAKRSFYDIVSDPFGATTEAAAAASVWSARAPVGSLDAALLARPEARAMARAMSVLNLFRRGEPLAILPNVFVR